MTIKQQRPIEGAPLDPVAYEAWLEESLEPPEAADFLGVKISWLDRKRTTAGGPKYRALTKRQIVYVRRDLIAFRDSKTYSSTSEYQRASGDGTTSTSRVGDD